jgi:ABC-type sulfate/molybdate transport systems ATPase subunit
VLILDEPDNDMDVDMLAVVESLLDSWPGTLLLITHDRYLMERVTDDQFALFDGKIRHVPGGVDEYLRLLDARAGARAEAKAVRPKPVAAIGTTEPSDEGSRPALSNVEERSLKKELAATERKLAALGLKAEAIRTELGEADPSDYMALVDAQGRLAGVEQEIAEVEDTWVGLSERLS